MARLRRRADKGPSLGAPRGGAGLPLIGGDARERYGEMYKLESQAKACATQDLLDEAAG